ncbi:MAG TPA: polysaccharide deacetylase family protein [Vicinamibacterales bacterium]|nr:polysaccharide deacetylase family protein [Vicinamibacterales bacterium]
MQYVPQGARFLERGGRFRGVLDLIAGHYPPFLFGMSVGDILPVFHFHETTPEALEPALAYLRDNGYRTVGADDLGAFVRGGRHPGDRTVVLTFDDAWASLWLVGGPLLKRYDMRAVVYAIPGRVRPAASVRPTLEQGPVDADRADAGPDPLCTWPELRALAASGHVDVQTHTQTHALVFSEPRAIGVVDPEYGGAPLLVRPHVTVQGRLVEIGPSRYGYPLFPCRSRMSDALAFTPDPQAAARLEAFVGERGGAAFFTRPEARSSLTPMLATVTGAVETAADRDRAIESELARSRAELEQQLGKPVRHACLPWGVTSEPAHRALGKLGFSTAVANRWPGRLAAGRGDDPFFVKRLHARHLFALPGRGRKVFVTLGGR